MLRLLRQCGRVLVVLALLASLGAHWGVLQSIAWTEMLIERTREHTLSEAVKTTFDGEHPCEMCKRIAESKRLAEVREKQEEKSPAIPEMKLKIEAVFTSQPIVFFVPQKPWRFPEIQMAAEARAESPPRMPPRVA